MSTNWYNVLNISNFHPILDLLRRSATTEQDRALLRDIIQERPGLQLVPSGPSGPVSRDRLYEIWECRAAFDPSSPDAPFAGADELLPRLAAFPQDDVTMHCFFVGDPLHWQEWYLVFTDVDIATLIGTLHGVDNSRRSLP